MVRLLCKDFRLASGDRKVGLRNLKLLGVIQFAIIDAMAVSLEAGRLSVFVGIAQVSTSKSLVPTITFKLKQCLSSQF
jgi:hypothetical protein